MKDNQIGALMTRRDFMKRSAVIGAGGLFLHSGVFAQDTTSSKINLHSNNIEIGIVGVGAQGRILQESILKIPDVKIVAVCDIWDYARQYALNKLKKIGQEARGYVDIEEMLSKEKLDAVVIASPDFWHAPHTNLSLRAGCHVYCEKMMSNTIEGARSMVHAMRETKKLLQIGHQRRSNPRYTHSLYNLVQKSNLLGQMTCANAQWNRAVADDLGYPKSYEIPVPTLKKFGYKDMKQFRNWRWYRELSGGPISDLGAHQIDIFNWFFGVRPRSLMAAGGTDYYKGREHYDNVMVIYEYPLPKGVARAFYQVQTTTSSGGGYFERFMGDRATLQISENPRLTKIYREATAPDWDEYVQKNYLSKEMINHASSTERVDVRETKAVDSYEIPIIVNKPLHQPHLENFFDAVRGKSKLNCDGEHAFESEASIFPVNAAVEARKMIDLNSKMFEI